MRYFDASSEEMHISEGLSAIIGFQEVLTDSKKVHVWMRQEVERPASTDRHRTTRRANHSHRKHEWGKSVWLKEEVWKHFSMRLEQQDITQEKFMSFEKDPECDIWIARDGSRKKFLQTFIINPVSEITKQKLNIQITQVAGKAPVEIYKRAYEESILKLGDYKTLADKYKQQAMVQTYSPYVNESTRVLTTKLTPVFVRKGNDKLPVYETSEIVLGDPHHIWVEYERFESIPVDTLEFDEHTTKNIIDVVPIVIGTKVPEEKELTLNFDARI